MSKFNKEQKIEIFHKWKDENISISQLAKAYRMNLANLDYMLRLIDMHGIEILTTKNQSYSKEFKQRTIEQAIFGNKPYLQLSLELGFNDSFPVPVCQPIRNYRVKIFRGIADIGYKATKKIYYYGFKVHALVSDDGYLLDYAVTKASVHDAKETTELMINAHPINHYLLGDEGYLGKDLAAELKGMGYVLWTPYRKNMKGAKKHNNHQLMAIRRTIESDFSLLSYYNAENNRARSLAGFQQRLEIAILAYNMAYCLERFN